MGDAITNANITAAGNVSTVALNNELVLTATASVTPTEAKALTYTWMQYINGKSKDDAVVVQGSTNDKNLTVSQSETCIIHYYCIVSAEGSNPKESNELIITFEAGPQVQ